MRILLLDIETSPYTAYIWQLNQRWINPDNIIDSARILCWSAKWLGEDEVFFDSERNNLPEHYLSNIHKLMCEADAVVHYNGTKFDIPILNREFLLWGMKPPAPSKQVDLFKVVKQRFKFPSSSLNYISKALKIGKKTPHKGFSLWTDCMKGDDTAWKHMEEYNKNDVILLEQVYYKLLPWIRVHPNRSLESSVLSCPNCGSESFQRRGFHRTATCTYQRYRCSNCGNWFRGGKSQAPTPENRGVNV